MNEILTIKKNMALNELVCLMRFDSVNSDFKCKESKCCQMNFRNRDARIWEFDAMADELKET